MATYKVPQDVEADDKLIGPFSFRQFIYLIIVCMAGAATWGLSNLFVPLSIIPIPVMIFFGALALPLRKDQPMEIYMAAIISFYLKPRKRMWDPDGIDSLIEITAPKDVEYQLTKDLSQTEAQRRFSYLADIVDSQGWAVRGVGVQVPNSAINNDIYFEAQQIEDIQDTNNTTAQTMKYKLEQSDAQHHQELVNIMNHKPVDNTNKYYTPIRESQPVGGIPIYNPYPDNIQQSVIRPISEQNEPIHTNNIQRTSTDIQNASTSAKPLPADIINLANNTDFSIEAIAREASRINKREEEVLIKLR
ncbi:MAG: PrgI family protein [Candidatus Paracaedibacteraceae bacterium]|nr:PrgI family protein [Candidatus Paracaedibacteraceae bacterium]